MEHNIHTDCFHSPSASAPPSLGGGGHLWPPFDGAPPVRGTHPCVGEQTVCQKLKAELYTNCTSSGLYGNPAMQH